MAEDTRAQTAFDLAVGHHQAGRLAEAEKGYREILAADSSHAGALHLLGVIGHQRSNPDVAVDLITKAVAIAPDYAEAHNNLGNALKDLGRLDEAVACYQRCIEVAPDYAMAHNNLGTVLRDQGKFDESVACYRRALEVAPKYAVAHNNLGSALNEQGKLDEAVASYRRALEIAPGYAMAHNNLGSVHKGQGKIDEAVACFRQALEIAPKYSEAHHNLGITLQMQGDIDGAIACFEKLLAIDPEYAPVHFVLSAALNSQGREREARNHLEEGIRRKPMVTVACEGREKPLATVFKLSSHERCYAWVEDGEHLMSTGSINEPLLLNPDKFTVHKYFMFEENLLKTAEDLPHFDVVVNGVLNPDSEQDSLATACRFIEQHDVPCINDPRKIAATSREKIADRLAGVDNLVVPRIVRAELSRRDTSLFMPIVEKHGLRLPLIVRPVGGHMGLGMIKIEREEDFAKAIFFENTLEFYFIEFHDYRSDDGYFRKIRFFFIGGNIYPYHLAISDKSLNHYLTSLMNDFEWMRREEESFLKDYVEYLSGCNDIRKILRDINEIIDLDYFGIDCALLKNGKLLFFESNPTMLVRLEDSPEIFPYKYVYVPRIFKAYEEMVLAKVRH